jgi:pimeloyl-ACP methyl ester carboxylesterase
VQQYINLSTSFQTSKINDACAFVKMQFVRIQSILLYFLISLRVDAVEYCNAESGGGICPTGNTCCLMQDGSSGCIASDMGKYNATCCEDRSSGCPIGYSCNDNNVDCFATGSSKFIDTLVEVLPRYKLCRAEKISQLYGLSIGDSGAQLAYYSSHGPVETISSEIDMVFIFIHGASRNADDYFCSGLTAIELQTKYLNVLLISPRFLAESDARDDPSYLVWANDGDGLWRYGTDAIAPALVSSYAALDSMVNYLWSRFPDMRQMTVAGHSSGGQTVQRWAMLTSSWRESRMRAIVANPSSYAYLTPLRFIDGYWRRPIKEAADCPQYNRWQWGLDTDGDIKVPYRDAALKNATEVVEQFKSRQVLYLAGALDRCNISKVVGWCHSHGLETTCMDNLQGSNRIERNERYMSSLRMIGIWKNHARRVVEGVGHDHSLMFQSQIGLESVFGEWDGEDIYEEDCITTESVSPGQ